MKFIKVNPHQTKVSQSIKLHKLKKHSKYELNLPFHIVKLSKSPDLYSQQHTQLKKQKVSTQNRINSISIDKTKQNKSHKNIQYLKKILSTETNLENTNKVEILKKQKKGRKNNQKINLISFKTLKTIKKDSFQSVQQIRQSLIYPINNKDEMIKNLQNLNTCLQKQKKNKYYGQIITQVSQKYQNIIQFMIKDNLNLINRSRKNNLENQKNYTSIKTLKDKNKDRILIKKPKNKIIQKSLELDLSSIKHQGISDYHDQFMSKADQFSQSWTQLIQKQKRF